MVFYSFKIRLLMVIVLAAVLGLVMQSNSPGKQAVEPVLQYIMTSDVALTETFNQLLPQAADNSLAKLPASARTLLKAPCDYIKVEKNYGSYWNEELDRKSFNPGMRFKVAQSTPVKAVLPGTVQAITRESQEYTVKIKHAGNLESIYGGLQEIDVKIDHPVLIEQVIGKTGDQFYFELRCQDDPVNPRSIFK